MEYGLTACHDMRQHDSGLSQGTLLPHRGNRKVIMLNGRENMVGGSEE